MNKNLANLAKEHADHGIKAKEKQSTFTLGDYEISALEYEALVEISSLYGSTPENEYERHKIKVKGGRVVSYNISGKGLEKIPDVIGDLSNLRYLSLAGNDLSSIPKSIGNLHDLRYLYLHGNDIKSIPSSVENLRNIRSFYLDKEKLDSSEEERINNAFGNRVVWTL
ncbi:MAG: hypothetical protein HZB68_03285 [Candidatus Aenigmarchaeota archaeon]|nr:hypothetical protein [Candidatus Aenigmarchaeota archaeon]